MVMKYSSEGWRAEAKCFAFYLIGGTIKEQYVELYIRALQSRNQKLPESESKLIQFALKHQWSIGYLDAGLALFHPEAELRRRLHIMLSILETVPEYADEFLPQAHPRTYLLVVGWTAGKASFKAVVGLALIKLAI